MLWSLAATALMSLPARAQNQYVGAKACAPCHESKESGSAQHAWRTSGHAAAFRALGTHTEAQPRACGDLSLWIVEVGRGVRYGLPRPAAESKECLPCHTTAFGAGAPLVAPSFDPRDGVQCESCHGPGGEHVAARSAAHDGKGAGGLRRYGDERAIAAMCGNCHEGTCGDFDFAAMWPKIRHSAPRANRAP
jgi:hypothetical protein